MGTLVLVRHGQASFLAEDYDRLSPLGELQARRLGEHWLATGRAFDRLYCGPRRRQRGTAEIVAGVLRDGGRTPPEIVMLDDLDEMRAEEVFHRSLPEVLAADEHLRHHMDRFSAAVDKRQAGRSLQTVFETVVRRWVHGEITVPDVEPWPAFCARVARAVATMRAGSGKGARIAAFTSGGTISAAMKLALGTSDPTTLELAWVVRNTALVEFLFSGERFNLQTFNAMPHLPESEWTHR